jgi:hypothetical protein
MEEVLRHNLMSPPLCANVSETPDPPRITVEGGEGSPSDDEVEEGQRTAAAAAGGRPGDDHACG